MTTATSTAPSGRTRCPEQEWWAPTRVNPPAPVTGVRLPAPTKSSLLPDEHGGRPPPPSRTDSVSQHDRQCRSGAAHVGRCSSDPVVEPPTATPALHFDGDSKVPAGTPIPPTPTPRPTGTARRVTSRRVWNGNAWLDQDSSAPPAVGRVRRPPASTPTLRTASDKIAAVNVPEAPRVHRARGRMPRRSPSAR